MKNRFILSMIAMAIVLQGCGKLYGIFHGVAPKSVTVESLDLTGATALAVMPYDGAAPQTKSGEYPDRLYIVDKDGKTKLASFTIKDSNSSSNKIWKKIRETLTLVPNYIFPLTDNYLLLSNTYPVYDYEWSNDAWGYEESSVIRDLLNSITGSYVLRLSDGALFRFPLVVENDKRDLKSLNPLIKNTKDNKTFVYSRYDFFEKLLMAYVSLDVVDAYYEPPYVITDMGDHFDLKAPSDLSGGGGGWSLYNDERIILYNAIGAWSFDMDLNPLFLDYSPDFKGINQYEMICLDKNGKSYIITGLIERNPIELYQVLLNGTTLSCELKASNSNDGAFPIVEAVYIDTPTGCMVLCNGSKINVNLKEEKIEDLPFPKDFPQGVFEYDGNGLSFKMDKDNITQYNINTFEKSIIPIQWGDLNTDVFVTWDNVYENGVFTVTAKTRTADTTVYVIDATTGRVIEASTSEYSGAIVRAYYRLN